MYSHWFGVGFFRRYSVYLKFVEGISVVSALEQSEESLPAQESLQDRTVYAFLILSKMILTFFFFWERQR